MVMIIWFVYFILCMYVSVYFSAIHLLFLISLLRFMLQVLSAFSPLLHTNCTGYVFCCVSVGLYLNK